MYEILLANHHKYVRMTWVNDFGRNVSRRVGIVCINPDYVTLLTDGITFTVAVANVVKVR